MGEDEPGLLLYEPYYGLSDKPFSLSTDPRFLFKSPSHTPVFKDVLAGIRRREGLVVLTGEIGMGKTTLCRSVLGALDRKAFSAFVPDPFVTREDLLKILLVEFGVIAVDDLVRGRLRGASRAELSYPLYEFLRSLEPRGAFAVLLLDEAQNLPVPLLEEIRILSDLEGARRLLQVVLIGQPELSIALRLPHMRQVRQRVTTQCELQPLTCEGVHGYVGHRLTVAGATADRVQFTGDALDLVFDASGGVPRVINRLCDRTLQRGHAARAATIGPDLVRGAIDDLQLGAALAPAAEPDGAAVPPAAPRPDRPPISHRQRATPEDRGETPRTSRTRAAAAAALVVLGVLSGMTMGVYWVWAGPLLTQRASVPAVKRPSARIGAPLPPVLPSAIDPNDVRIVPAEPNEEPAEETAP